MVFEKSEQAIGNLILPILESLCGVLAATGKGPDKSCGIKISSWLRRVEGILSCRRWFKPSASGRVEAQVGGKSKNGDEKIQRRVKREKTSRVCLEFGQTVFCRCSRRVS